jgi:co-chaperonin GroES (HSP10)
MAIKPVRDKLLMRELAKENKTASGLILTSDTDTGSKPGVVVSQGEDVKGDYTGKTVYVRWGHGLAVEDNGVQMVLIDEEYIAGIIE